VFEKMFGLEFVEESVWIGRFLALLQHSGVVTASCGCEWSQKRKAEGRQPCFL
jgi:hypothetical protein